jgi:magnesium transporter
MLENKFFMEEDDRSHRRQILALIQEITDPEALRAALEDYHDNDIAGVLEELTPEERIALSSVIGTEAMSEIVPYLEDPGEYLSSLDTESAADILEQMDADDALQALEELEPETRDTLLSQITDDEVKEDLALLVSYNEEEFGRLMSTNFISVPRSFSVKEAMRALVAQAADTDHISTIFVTDEEDRFYGAMDLKELIVARSTVPLEELIATGFPFVCDRERISDRIEGLRSYSEDLIPVLSSEDHRLLGVITAQDITDLVDEELGDDYAKLAALGSEEEKDEPLVRSMKKRVPWLIVLLFMGLAVSAVVGFFEGVVDELPMLVAFQSLILGMAGNVGTQSLAVTVRGLGSDRKPSRNPILKETRIAFLNGIALGLISFLIVSVYLLLFGSHPLPFVLSSAGCVGGAMCFAMTVSGMTGAAIPLCLSRLGADPAVASGPLITTVNDLVAVVSYYGLAWGLLLNFR